MGNSGCFFRGKPAAIESRYLACSRRMRKNHQRGWGGGGVAQLVRASDRHAADAGSIPRCGKGCFSQSQLSVQTLLRCPYIPVCNRTH